MKYFFSFILLLFSASAISQDTLKVLTWNIQMLPRFINSNGKAKRARVIVDQLKTGTYDVVVFQEMFKKRSRRIIRKGLEEAYPHQTPVLNKKMLSFKTNGGVMIFSKHPIVEVHQIRYRECTGFDRLSRKGAIMAEVDVRGKRVQVAGTHLQAFGETPIMYSQYQQLYDELLNRYAKSGVPQIACGDFNTLKIMPPGISQELINNYANRIARYSQMIKTLDALDGDLAGEQQFTMDRPYNDMCDGRKEARLLLDYVLVRPNGRSDLSISRQVRIMRYQWHKDHQDLSDHFGLEAVITGF